MIGKSLYPYMLLVLFASVSPVTQAATISLTPIIPATGPGIAAWDLWMDFSDNPMLDGALDIFYNNSVLDFLGFEFDTDFLGPISDPFVSHTADDLPGEVNGIAFGSIYRISGPYRVGTL